VKIMTGAIMPAGLDTVVPQEFTVSPPLPGGTRVASIAAGVLRLGGDNRRFKLGRRPDGRAAWRCARASA
jgi:molybdopterin molybdotransferase